ncbi:hypothetical protein COO59_06190 [Mixta theicola]|uniref:Uncharacterized protein n=1 Tax=Mixta theicola TaxID=1458355 RepID=A0A2K1QCD8_9GAMM|nr:hypothetical protein COO59_06190 [Mixta theicola]
MCHDEILLYFHLIFHGSFYCNPCASLINPIFIIELVIFPLRKIVKKTRLKIVDLTIRCSTDTLLRLAKVYTARHNLPAPFTVGPLNFC